MRPQEPLLKEKKPSLSRGTAGDWIAVAICVLSSGGGGSEGACAQRSCEGRGSLACLLRHPYLLWEAGSLTDLGHGRMRYND